MRRGRYAGSARSPCAPGDRVHGASLPYCLKLRLARKTLAHWTRGPCRRFSAAHRRLNRVFGGLVAQPAPGVALEMRDARPLLRRPSGETRSLDDVALALWRGCDGRQTAAQLARAVRTHLPVLPDDSGPPSVRRGLHELLAAGFLTAVNQSEPLFAEPGPRASRAGSAP